MRWLRLELSSSRARRGMRMPRFRLIWRESLTMTRIRCAATMGMNMEKADAAIMNMEKVDVGIIVGRMSGSFLREAVATDSFIIKNKGGAVWVRLRR